MEIPQFQDQIIANNYQVALAHYASAQRVLKKAFDVCENTASGPIVVGIFNELLAIRHDSLKFWFNSRLALLNKLAKTAVQKSAQHAYNRAAGDARASLRAELETSDTVKEEAEMLLNMYSDEVNIDYESLQMNCVVFEGESTNVSAELTLNAAAARKSQPHAPVAQGPLRHCLPMRYDSHFGWDIYGGQPLRNAGGVACTPNGNIFVADTGNHRIVMFDQRGSYKFGFGHLGFPNRLAYCALRDLIIVTDRWPAQVQTYRPNGTFVQKFGTGILAHPRDVAVDDHGRIIVLENRIGRVTIFQPTGMVFTQFPCDRVAFPIAVAVNNRGEIFVADNKEGSVSVFNYNGDFLRAFGDWSTKYLTSLLINFAGDCMVASNNYQFKVTTVAPGGNTVCVHESVTKHAGVLDMKWTNQGNIAMLSGDNQVYLYSPAYHQMVSAGP